MVVIEFGYSLLSYIFPRKIFLVQDEYNPPNNEWYYVKVEVTQIEIRPL